MEPYYITTPIYYVNDRPHIGTSYTSIACDIFSRYQKLKGKKVYFLTGTDEHGQKVEKEAINSKLEPKDFVNQMSKHFRDLIPFLGCNIDDFIRTTEQRHIEASQYLWKKLYDNNQIYLSNYEGWYSVRDEAFYLESELTKQNDSFYAPSGSPVEWVKEESYFFKLSEWQEKLINFYEKNPDTILPKSRYNEVLSFIKGGLKDLSISRTTFNWGVKVPNNDKHVMYVWIDALCNYLTSLGYPNIDNDKFKTFWPAVHIIGKDILRFHAVYWPAFLMAAEIPPPKKIIAHGWWTNEGKKISKSTGNAIDPYEIINEYGLDQIRFYLFREVPFGNDGDFSKESIHKRINSDLSNNLGNLVQRICSFINKNCNSDVSNKFDLNDDDKKLINNSNLVLKNYISFMDNYEIDKALKQIFDLLSLTNTYIDSQEPWNLKKIDLDRMNIVLSVSVEIIRRASILLFPVIPKSIEKIFSILNMKTQDISFQNFDKLNSISIKINKSFHIFPRIDLND